MDGNERILRIYALRDGIRTAAVRSPDLLRPDYRARVEAGAHPLTGHCYVASEAFFHAAKDLDLDLYPETFRVGGQVHWRLRSRKFPDLIIDLTEDQFIGRGRFDTTKARGRGFLTKKPSKRAVEMLKRAGLWDEDDA